MKFARGRHILMLDADGATEISEYQNLLKVLNEIKNGKDEAIVVGSRNVVTQKTHTAEVKKTIIQEIIYQRHFDAS
jgi:hypothetical protein